MSQSTFHGSVGQSVVQLEDIRRQDLDEQ
jgi:hypothetical protein